MSSVEATVDRVMADERAAGFATRSIKKASKIAGLRLAVSMIDLTTLEGADSPGRVRRLCAKAARPDGGLDSENGEPLRVGAVCVYPELAAVARAELDRLGAADVPVAAVATGFPSGQYPLAVRLDDARRAAAAGATEIDMVISRGRFLAGDRAAVADEVARTKAAVAEESGGRAHLKVILETGELGPYDNVRSASHLAMESGLGPGDFIKTSTGKVSPAATPGVTLVMLEAIREHYLRTGVRIGMKPAGGIRTSKQALAYLVMVKETLGDGWLTPGLFRIGASSLLDDILLQLRRMRAGVYASPRDVPSG